jgi:hypothetical protein
MVAESKRVRRLRRHFGTHRKSWLGAGVAGIAALLVAAPAVAAPLMGDGGMLSEAIQSVTRADASPARSATTSVPVDDADGGVELSIAPTLGAAIDPAAPVTIDVEMDNRTGEPLAAGSIRLTRPASTITDQSALDAWLDAPTAEERDRPRTEPVAEAAARALPAGASETVSFTLPAGALGAAGEAPVAGLGADLVIDGVTTTSATGAFPFTTATAVDGPRLALAYAITVPAEASGIIDADALTLWTGPSGLLTRQLDAVADRPVAIALDPRLVASIRVLGSDAPPTAVTWLDRLAAVSNEIFPLAYADADLAAQAQLGIEPLAPESFADVLDPADFAEPVEGAAGAAGAGSAPAGRFTPTEGEDTQDPTESVQPVEPTVPAGTVPTTEQLLAWPYTRTDLAWPAGATVATGNLAAFEDAGYTTTILDAANVEAGAPSTAGSNANAASTVEGESAVVADSRLSGALRDAAAARSQVAWGDAASRLGAQLAMLADDGGNGVLLATFQRGADTQSARVAGVLDALASWSWSAPASLSEAIGAPPVERALVDSPEDSQRLNDLQRLLDSEAGVQEFSTVLTDPSVLTAPARRQLLALLDVAWLTQPSEWAGEVGDRLVAQTETVHSVTIAQSSNINVLSSETGVPTTIENLLPYPVTVFVDVAPSNGRLIVEERVETTVAADSRSNVIVPVAAGVGNGEVTLSVSLWSPDEIKIGETVQITANVQADWEGLGALILGVIAVAVFGIGIWRNIRRRRRARADAAEQDTADVAGSQYPASHAEATEPGVESRADVDKEPRRDG